MSHDFFRMDQNNAADFELGRRRPEAPEEVKGEEGPSEEISQQEAWVVIRSYFEENGLVSQQIGSYNHFLSTTVQEIINENPVIPIYPERQYTPQESVKTNLKYELHLGHLSTAKKPMIEEVDKKNRPIGPQEARLRNLTYETDLYISITKRTKKVDKEAGKDEEIEEPELANDILIAKVPVMVRSKYCALNGIEDSRRVKEFKECQFDQGGYFIIKGGEKVIIAQERMASNFVNVFKKRAPSKYSWTAEVRSNMEASNRPPAQFAVKMLSLKSSQSKISGGGFYGQPIRASLPYIKTEIPIVVLFRALGLRSDKSIVEHICYDPNDKAMMEALRPSLEEGFPIQTQENALDYIGKRGTNTTGSTSINRTNYARDKLEKDMLPHVATTPNNEPKKAFFIGYMVHRLCNAALGRAGEDDRDHYGKKRLDMAGSLLGSLFRQLFRKFIEEATKSLKRDVDSNRGMKLPTAFKSKLITTGLRNALATGNWGSSKAGQVLKTGVSQVLNRLTFASSLSHLRRLNTPLQKQGKLSKPRQLHNTHWGMVCPAETPEGQACGLVKNLTLLANVSIGVYTKSIVDFCESWGTENLVELNPASILNNAKVFVNGSWIGIHHDPEGLIRHLRNLRRRCQISKEVSIVRDIGNREIKYK